MPGVGNLSRLPSEKSSIYADLQAALFRLRDWLGAHTATEAAADVVQGEPSELVTLLRAAAKSIRDAEARSTLQDWRSGKGLQSWDRTRHGQVMRGIIWATDDLEKMENEDPEKAKEHWATWAGALFTQLHQCAGENRNGEWCDFQGIVEYVEEVLGALNPEGPTVAANSGDSGKAARIAANADTQEVIFDGRVFQIADLLVFKLFAALIKAHHDHRTPIKRGDLFDAVGKKLADPRLSKVFQKLPVALRKLIVPVKKTRGGLTLRLPAQNKN